MNNRIFELEQEVERLREALITIAGLSNLASFARNSDDYGKIAREALKEAL